MAEVIESSDGRVRKRATAPMSGRRKSRVIHSEERCQSVAIFLRVIREWSLNTLVATCPIVDAIHPPSAVFAAPLVLEPASHDLARRTVTMNSEWIDAFATVV